MHIQEGKPNKKTSDRSCGPKHCYCGGRGYQPKHAQEAAGAPRKGVGAYIVAFLFLICVVVFHEYAFLAVPLAVVSLVLSICAVSRRATGYSVMAVIISSLAAVLMTVLIVLLAADYFMGTSMESAVMSFTVFS